jgi:hypothetical protein
MRRHHLIEEAKAELDVAYEEVKRAEAKIMRLELDYNERIKTADTGNGAAADIAAMTAEKGAIQDSVDLEALYDLQSSAVERFSKVSAAFAIVASVDDQGVCVDLMRNILFHDGQAGAKKRDVDAALRTFAQGLRAYSRQEANPTNDRKVRESWTAIETLISQNGRAI